MFSPGGRLFPKLRPRPAPRAGAGRASPLGARRPSAAALFERSCAGHGSGHSAPDGSSKPDGGTASIVSKVIFRRPGRRQAPAPNPHPFLSSSFASFAGARTFPFAGFQSHPPLCRPAHKSLSQFSYRCSVQFSVHFSPRWSLRAGPSAAASRSSIRRGAGGE